MITSYTILIQQNDGDFAESLTTCDGTDAAIISAAECSIPIDTLRSAPFSHDWGASIYAKVIATNIVGSSLASDVGNGALILTTPDPPVNLSDNVSITSNSQVGLLWEDGAETGGSPIIDYRLWVSTGGDYIVTRTGILTRGFTFPSAVSGTTYSFKVQARTLGGYSDFSDPVSVLAASVPSKPDAPVTVWSADQITLIWTAPSSNGSPITSYSITIQTKSGDYQASVSCDGSV